MVMTKEETKLYMKEYYQKNKEKIAKYSKEYKQSKKAKMNDKISNWKRKPKNGYGLICESRDEYEYIYDRWLNSEMCEEPKCNKEYSENNIKTMDHCHDTGLFRDIICNSCNVKRTTKENSSGTTNIIKSKRSGWEYKIRIKGKRHIKYSTDLEWLKQYKIDYENKYLYNI